MVTLVIVATAAVLTVSILSLSSNRMELAKRNFEYESSQAAAVSATEKTVTYVEQDFQRGSETHVARNLATYRSLVPTAKELPAALQDAAGTSANASWNQYQFSDGAGQPNQTAVQKLCEPRFCDLKTKFIGLRGYAADYRIISGTRRIKGDRPVSSTIQQEVQLASIPVFQFQLFYVPDLEICSAAPWTLNGRVHGNQNIFLQPGGSLTFQNHVTASRRVMHTKHPLDPVTRVPTAITYRAERESGVNTLSLGTNNTPSALHAILERPPLGELATSPLGQMRFFNKADLIILVTNGQIFGQSGIYNGCSILVPNLRKWDIVTIPKEPIYDKRECKEFDLIEINIGKLKERMPELTTLLGRPVKIVWVANLGAPLDATPRAVRVRHGDKLPTAGLTIATPNPLYVWGDFNKSPIVPACLAADAITVLSKKWNDGDSGNALQFRTAEDTVLNAAVIPGIVPTGEGVYSGGAENAVRLLEDWEGKRLTFNGALAVLFYSAEADAPWGGPDVYSPPIRNFTYDLNLSQAATTPPGTPEVHAIFRSDWTSIKSTH